MSVTQAQFEQSIEDVRDKSGAYAYLSASSTTTTTSDEAWAVIGGSFVNDFENFEFDTDHIKYIGDNDYVFEIDWHASVSSDTAATTFHITVKKNTTTMSDERMGGLLQTQNVYTPCSGTTVVTLTKNDEIQLVCQSDKNADLTFEHFNTSINKFYQSRV